MIVLVDRTNFIDPEFAAIMRINGAPDENTKVRKVNVPDDEVICCKSIRDILELVFRYGQNDFQSVPNSPSVSVNDIILFNDMKFKVDPVGFSKVR